MASRRGEEERRRGAYAFVEHTWSLTPNDDPDSVLTADELGRVPSYVAVRSKDALLVRDDLDYSPSRTDDAYELYDRSRTPWERTDVYGGPRYAEEVGVLMAKLAQFDRCAAQQEVRARVSRACRDMTSARR